MESAANVRSGTGARIRHVRGDMTQEAFGARYGISVATVRNYECIRDPAADFLAALAADGWSVNWLLTGRGPERVSAAGRIGEAPPPSYGAPSQDLSADTLSIALELADEALRGLWLPRRGYAELVALVYDALSQGLPYGAILDFARPAARQRAGAGGSDDGGDGLDRSGPPSSGKGETG